MMSNHNNQTYYERLKNKLLNIKPVAWIVLIAIIVLAVVNYYNELLDALRKAWPEKGVVLFTTPHVPLRKHGMVEIKKNSHRIHVTNFDAPVHIELGAYKAAAHIDSRTLLSKPFMVRREENVIAFDARFAVKGIVVNGRGRPLTNVIVKVNDRSMETKNDGRFIIDSLPMQRKYDIEAYLERGNNVFSPDKPWTGTVYNANWDIVMIHNIDLVW